jgi:hypothetical protein
MEIMITLADGDERGDKVITRGVLVVERRVTEPMRERVYAKRRMVDKRQARGTCEEETAPPISPTETGDGHREEESHGQHQREVVFVLPSDNLVACQVGDVGYTDLGSWFEDHPAAAPRGERTERQRRFFEDQCSYHDHQREKKTHT